jgi:hypothetical protein
MAFAIKATAAVLTVLLLVGAWIWTHGAERRAVRNLPLEERGALYHTTLGTLRGPCGASQPSDGLDAFCRKQAEFIVEFPECDGTCMALARAHLSSAPK